MKRAPKKFTDESQSEITPEWKEWFSEYSDFRREDAMNHLAGLGDDPQDRYPEEYGKDVGDGAWILVVEEPFTELKSRFTVPAPSLWWARPEVSKPYGMSIGSSARKVMIPGIYRVVIETPGGSLWLFPHEYIVCQDPLPLITDPECTIHRLGGGPDLDEDQQEEMFYLQSRGITRSDALLLVMGERDMSDWGWVEFPEYARAAYEGVGRSLQSHIQANPRRTA